MQYWRYIQYRDVCLTCSTLTIIWPNGGSRWFPPSGSDLTEYWDSSNTAATPHTFEELSSTLDRTWWFLQIQIFQTILSLKYVLNTAILPGTNGAITWNHETTTRRSVTAAPHREGTNQIPRRDPTNGSTTKFPPVQHRRLLLHNISGRLCFPFHLLVHSSILQVRLSPAPFHRAFPVNLTESFRPPRLLFGFHIPLLIF